MITRHLSMLFAGAVVAAASLPTADAQILKDTQQQIAPGFNPDNGKINPGVPVQGPSSAPPGLNDHSGNADKVTNRVPPVDTTAASNEPIPTPEEARAALLSPDSADPAIGQIAPSSAGGANTAKSAVGDAPSEMAKSQQADNTAQSSDSKSPDGSNQTTGAASREEAAKHAAELTTPEMPIGSTSQTLPAKFSKRNNTLDRLPTMAWPMRLTDEERRRIYQAVMADKSAAATGVENLKPASQLDTNVALGAMHDLPNSLADMTGLKPYKFIKAKDKVFLVTPATRTVADVITN